MRFSVQLFLLVISCACLALANVTYDDCCLKYVKMMSKTTQRHAVRYRRQVPDGGCNIPAVIFTMKRGREFCTNPDDNWVKNLMMKIDAKHERQRHNKQNPRRPYKG